MKFSIVVNHGPVRSRPGHARRGAPGGLELVQIADQGGFDIAWTAEHHTIEVTIAPNPLNLLTYWGQHTDRIRLGTAVVSAPYWHPIRLAGEAALTDLLLDGRLEARLRPRFLSVRVRPHGRRHASGRRRQVPARDHPGGQGAVEAATTPMTENSGSFPSLPRCPSRCRNPIPGCGSRRVIPNTFDFAVKNGCHIMSTPAAAPARRGDHPVRTVRGHCSQQSAGAAARAHDAAPGLRLRKG